MAAAAVQPFEQAAVQLRNLAGEAACAKSRNEPHAASCIVFRAACAKHFSRSKLPSIISSDFVEGLDGLMF